MVGRTNLHQRLWKKSPKSAIQSLIQDKRTVSKNFQLYGIVYANDIERPSNPIVTLLSMLTVVFQYTNDMHTYFDHCSIDLCQAKVGGGDTTKIRHHILQATILVIELHLNAVPHRLSAIQSHHCNTTERHGQLYLRINYSNYVLYL